MEKIDLEQKIKEAVDARGGRMRKISVEDEPCFPGYMVILPGGHVGFVEIGRPKEIRLKALREHISNLRTLGCAAMLIDCESQINRMVMYILSDAGKDPSWNAYQDYKTAFEMN